MTYIVLGILIIEIVRLALSILDSVRVKKLNDKMAVHYIERDKEQKELRLAELEAIKDLAQGSHMLEGIYKDYKTMVEKDQQPPNSVG